jgi:hypothetical protein
MEGFWMIGAHGEKKLEGNAAKALDTAYILVKEKEFYDAWAQLYISKKHINGHFIVIRYTDFTDKNTLVMPGDKRVAIYGGLSHSPPLTLEKGTYRISISAIGTKAANELPHLNVYFADKKISSYYVTEKMEQHSFQFENPATVSGMMALEFDNDYYAPPKEDRNIFLEYIIIERLKK